MGKNADLRLKFIEENAPKVKNYRLIILFIEIYFS